MRPERRRASLALAGLGAMSLLPLASLAAEPVQWQPLPGSTSPSPTAVPFKPLPPGSEGSGVDPSWTPVDTLQGPTAPPSWEPLPEGAIPLDGASPAPSPQSAAPTSFAEAQERLLELKPTWSDYPPILRLGQLPTAALLTSSDFQIEIGQVSPFGSGESGGTGNQNYMGYLSLGITDNLQLSAFYTQADDPLYAFIPNKQPQPANRWDATGAALRLRLGHSGAVRFALESSLEKFYVKSGGTNSFNSTSDSANIFNSAISPPVENNNLASSITLPISWQVNRKLELTFTPGVSFLPSSQGNSNGSGTFYGTNIFIGTGLIYQPAQKIQLFGSAMVPLGPGNNSFDSNLAFKRVPIFTGGLRLNLNPRIALEGYLTNGFGETPSTAILALPSENRLLYAGRLVYTPTRPDERLPSRPSSTENLSFGGLSVNNAALLAAGSSKLRTSLDSHGTFSSRFDLGFSDSFQFDLAVAQVATSSNPSSSFAQSLLIPGNPTVRGAGTALFFSQPRGDGLSTALRLSYGRVLAPNDRSGYFFGEILNTKDLSKAFSINLNPKIALSGVENLFGLGLSANWQFSKIFSLIPEVNIALAGGAQSNYTLALRSCPSRKLCVDLYGTTSLSLQDAGQLLTSESPGIGLNVSWKY
jgi:hypothetical protein